VGHGLWTAILGGVLFAGAARSGRLRLTGSVVAWYVVVALLHALWDASQPIAAWLTLRLTATPVQWLLIDVGRVPSWSHTQVHLFTGLSWALLVFDALVGLRILRGRRRQATRIHSSVPISWRATARRRTRS
ncbi:MAG TPA: PrsW family glutamic-type intramembrane protease, partial [Pseudonocardiaceae bacterium]|nr:PrsW family glutamic-type intramembrane protease [Pseudonocardiaceae bacterium]